VPNKNFLHSTALGDKPRSSTSPLVIEHPRRVTGNPEVTSSPVGLVPTNAFVSINESQLPVVWKPEVTTRRVITVAVGS
jgi:hypothetical protein